MTEETRTSSDAERLSTESAVVLVTDLVGSTELSFSVSPEEADELRRMHFSSLRKGVASAGGSEVKNLGDGLLTVFPTASAALACAVAMQQNVVMDSRRTGRDLGLRIGIGGGEVTKAGQEYSGEPVLEAASLCARAAGGQILASDVVRALAGRHSGRVFRPLAALELKGSPEPLEVLEVGWERPDDQEVAVVDAVPLPRRLQHRPRTGVIGRDLDLARTDEAYKRVAAQQGREVVLIGAEAGQGKTTFAAEAARRAHRSGATVLYGRCDEELVSPYGPFVEALQYYVSHAPESILNEAVAKHGSVLASLAPAIRSRISELPAVEQRDAETDRYLLYASVLGLFSEAARETPIVLVLDDLQWADSASLQLLRHLVKATEPIHILIIATYRDTELTLTHRLTETLANLQRESRVRTIDLKGLNDQEVVEFLEASAGHSLTGGEVHFAHAVYGETDGNPFFVTEVLLHLVESGVLYQDDTGRWVAAGDWSDVPLPQSVREVVAARVARLGSGTVRLLALASVIGRDFDIEHLCRIVDEDEGEVLDLLEGASASSLVREVPESPGRFSFSHALVQHTLYQDLGTTRRARTHRRVAEALEELCGNHPESRIDELAYHWSRATQPVDAGKAISYAQQAAKVAIDALAPSDAVRYYSQALLLLQDAGAPDPVLELELLLGLGTAQRQSGNPEFRATLLDAAQRARSIGDADRLVQAALANNRGFFSAVGVVDAEKVGALEAALGVVPADQTAERAVLLATLCSELSYGPLQRRMELAAEAKHLARECGDAATMIDVLNLLQLPLNIPATHDERTRDSAQAVALAEDLGDPVRHFWAVHFDCNNAMQEGAFDRFRRHLGTMRSLSERLGQPMLAWVTTYHEATEKLLAGDTASAEDLVTRALELGTESSQPDAFAFYGAQLIVVRSQQGRVGELAALISEVANENPEIAAYQAAVAGAHLDAQQEDEASQVVMQAARTAFSNVAVDTAWLDAIVVYARVVVELRLAEPAAQLFDLLKPYHTQIPYQGLTLHEPVAVDLGALAWVLERYEDAESYFAEASSFIQEGRMGYADARLHLELGRMLARRGRSDDLDRARQLLQSARATGASKGYTAVERRAEAALNAMPAVGEA